MRRVAAAATGVIGNAVFAQPILYIHHRFLWLIPAALFSSAAFAGADGGQLYAQHCNACHGAQGTGSVGVPLSLPDFLSQVDDRYLRQTIRLGRPGRVMPAFKQLDDAQVAAIAAHIRSWQKKPSAKPVTVHPGDATRGGTLYARHCASCHGPRGEGGHGTGVTFSRPRNLPILPPALNNTGFLASADDALIKAAVLYGRRGTPMPAARKLGLKEKDVDDIVAYVRAFEKTPLERHAVDFDAEPAIIVRESPYDVTETVEKLKVAVSIANMRLIRAEPFDKNLAASGQESSKQFIIDACDFHFLNEALKVDPRIGLFLPCRFTVVEHDGKVLAMSINPKRLGGIFNNSELDQLCTQMKKVYASILEEGIF